MKRYSDQNLLSILCKYTLFYVIDNGLFADPVRDPILLIIDYRCCSHVCMYLHPKYVHVRRQLLHTVYTNRIYPKTA